MEVNLMARPPTAAEITFVNQRTRPVVRAQRPRLHHYWGYVHPLPANTTPPSIAGTATVGSTATCTPGVWTNATSVARQWRRGATNIAGATGLTYVFVVADGGATITCQEIATGLGGSAQATSNGLAVQGAPVNTVAPAVTPAGTVINGATLTTTNGTWTNVPTFTRAWRRNGVAIGGQTALTYVTQAADAGTNVDCLTTGTNTAGSASAASNAVAVT
jgi:hypothetical protein